MEELCSILAMGGGGSTGGTNILLQAVGAAMRGEDAQSFMKRLANQHPQLKRMNLDDLQGTASELCRQNGLDANELATRLDNVINPVINK